MKAGTEHPQSRRAPAATRSRHSSRRVAVSDCEIERSREAFRRTTSPCALVPLALLGYAQRHRVTIPRQSRGLSIVSRSKRLVGVANATSFFSRAMPCLPSKCMRSTPLPSMCRQRFVRSLDISKRSSSTFLALVVRRGFRRRADGPLFTGTEEPCRGTRGIQFAHNRRHSRDCELQESGDMTPNLALVRHAWKGGAIDVVTGDQYGLEGAHNL